MLGFGEGDGETSAPVPERERDDLSRGGGGRFVGTLKGSAEEDMMGDGSSAVDVRDWRYRCQQVKLD